VVSITCHHVVDLSTLLPQTQLKRFITVMQNIEAFQKALVAYGVPAEDLFQTVDLWEKRNIPAVTKTIYALSRTVSAKI